MTNQKHIKDGFVERSVFCACCSPVPSGLSPLFLHRLLLLFFLLFIIFLFFLLFILFLIFSLSLLYLIYNFLSLDNKFSHFSRLLEVGLEVRCCRGKLCLNLIRSLSGFLQFLSCLYWHLIDLKVVLCINGHKERASRKCVGHQDIGHTVVGLGPGSNSLYWMLADVGNSYLFVSWPFFGVSFQVDFVAKRNKFVLIGWGGGNRVLNFGFNIIDGLNVDLVFDLDIFRLL